MTEYEKTLALINKNHKTNERLHNKLNKIRDQELKAAYQRYKGGFFIMASKESPISKYEMTAFKALPSTNYSSRNQLRVMKWELYQEKDRYKTTGSRRGYGMTGREYTYCDTGRLDKYYKRVNETEFNKYLAEMKALIISTFKD